MSVPGSNPFAQAAPPAAPDSPNVSDTDDLLVVSGATYLTFGMHQNSSYEFVAEQHPDYCGYCLSLTDTVGAMKQFQEWLRRAGMGGGLEARGRALVAFGAHKGKKFADVFQSEPGYCDWILRELNKGEATKALKVFGGYVADRRSVQQAAQQ